MEITGDARFPAGDGAPTGRVLCTGEPLIVLVPNRRGSLDVVDGFRPYVAGAELNTAIGLARLGICAALACAIGDDPFGARVVRALRAEGVDTDWTVRIPDAQTAVFFKQWTGLDLSTSVYYYRSASPMARGQWDAGPVVAALAEGRWDWLHVTGITGMVGPDALPALLRLMEAAWRAGCTVSFDINVRLKLAGLDRWRELAERVAPWTHWYLTGDEEARWLFGSDDAAEVEARLRAHGFAGTGVIVKCGEQGAVASTNGARTEAAAWPVREVVDTVGAGDGFNAGWIAGMMRGWPLAEAMRLGTLAGAFAVTAEGDYEGYPAWEEAMRYMQRQGTILR